MKLEERKKNIEKKLEYLGIKEKSIKEILNYPYSLLGRLKKEDIKLEKLVNHHYQEIRETREETNKIKITLMNKNYNLEEIFYN